jgi:SAM-dependent methyltransferase
LFASRLDEIKSKCAKPNALDFGAGSLRDSYELSKLGFRVVSVDLDEEILSRYCESYDWDSQSAPTLFTSPLESLALQTGQNFFDLAIAFDVIEHLEDPVHYCRQIRSLLREQGMLFTIVPNRRSIFETYFRHTVKRQREKGVPLKPGVPHLQFKTPAEWRQFFENNGFRVLEHDMTIGFLVNDCWNGLLGLPLRVYVCPVLQMLGHILRLNFNASDFEQAFSPSWMMERVNVWDQFLRKPLKNRFGWNLIIAQKVR